MKNRLNHKKGMIVLVIAAGLVVVSIIFASIVNRMRAEALITNRVSITERLNQFASAIGRLAIRKLQRDIELVNTEDGGHGSKIVQAIMNGDNSNNSQLSIEDTNYTSVLERMEVVKNLKSTFEEKFGSQGKIDTLDVSYKINLNNGGFGCSIDGVVNNPFERRGSVDMVVTVSIPYGIKRKYTVRKEFVFARLLAPPFYRFTLFSPEGATVSNETANSCIFDDTGELQSNTRPFICLNRRLAGNDTVRTQTNYVGNPQNIIQHRDAKAFIQNGWIYLGGSPDAMDLRKNKRLILNVAPGSDDDDLKTKFGEYFHFYYDSSDSGWLNVKSWTDFFKTGWLNSQTEVNLSVVDYGLYPKLFTETKFAGVDLFKDSVEYIYKGRMEAEHIPNYESQSKLINKCSSMHLFGTPKHCTPTLIFGPINRRFLKAHALFFPSLGRVFPLPGIKSNEDIKITFAEEGDGPFTRWFKSKVPGDQGETDAVMINNRIRNIGTDMNNYNNGCEYLDPSLKDGIGPLIIDDEPYMKALVNMSCPRDPDSAKINQNGNAFISEPEDLCDPATFEFTDAHKEESKYKGTFDQIKIDYNSYLKEGTTYTISNGNATEAISIKDNPFIQKHFFVEARDKKYFLLNQIIRIDGDLDIDEDLYVAQGGIIIASGTITIKSTILNKIVEEGMDRDDPNNFGYLTLIARKGIKIEQYPGASNSSSQLPPKLEAFLIAGLDKDGFGDRQQVSTSQPVRIIGGVAADYIDDLVKTGSIVEWGLEPGECTNYGIKDFYGLTLGPRDIELYTAE